MTYVPPPTLTHSAELAALYQRNAAITGVIALILGVAGIIFFFTHRSLNNVRLITSTAFGIPAVLCASGAIYALIKLSNIKRLIEELKQWDTPQREPYHSAPVLALANAETVLLVETYYNSPMFETSIANWRDPDRLTRMRATLNTGQLIEHITYTLVTIQKKKHSLAHLFYLVQLVNLHPTLFRQQPLISDNSAVQALIDQASALTPPKL